MVNVSEDSAVFTGGGIEDTALSHMVTLYLGIYMNACPALDPLSGSTRYYKSAVFAIVPMDRGH